jgi:DDE superfamily endonuclease
VAAGKRGLKRGLKGRVRTVRLMLDETIITETPPLYSCYGRIGQQVCVPITGNRSKRILHGALNVGSGDVLLLITWEWVQETHQAFLEMVRAHGRGWHLVLFQDRGSPHTADESVRLAAALGIEVRWLPKATPELNAMDQLWRRAKGQTVASRATETVDRSADEVCAHILRLTPRQRLRQAGVLSGNFWLAD